MPQQLNPDLLAAIGPRVRKSPFFDSTVRAGLSAVTSYNHMWLPMSYGDPDAEYERLVDGVSMWDVAAQRHIEIVGTDADQFVQRLTIADVSETDVGWSTYAPMVDHDGVLINDPILIHTGRTSWRFSIADGDVRPWISALGVAWGLDVLVRELPTATLAIQGPRAMAVARGLFGSDVERLDDMQHCRVERDGIDLLVSRSGWSTQGGVEVFLDDIGRARELWERVAQVGAAHDIGPGAPNPSERIENVLLSYGTDTGYEADPVELGLEPLIDLEHDFVGRTAVRRVLDDGPARRLVGVVVDGPTISTLPHPRPCLVDGRPVGDLRAAAHSPRFDRNLGLALLDAQVAPGASVRVDLPHEDVAERTGRLVELPFEEDDVAG